MRWREEGAWFGLGCGLAGGLLAAIAFIPTPTHAPVATPAPSPTMMVDVVEPAAAPPPAPWPPVQRPVDMVVPEEEPPEASPLGDVEMRDAFWDPDSAVAPSMQPTRPAAPRWNPDTAIAPPAKLRASGPIAVWDPDSPVPPT